MAACCCSARFPQGRDSLVEMSPDRFATGYLETNCQESLEHCPASVGARRNFAMNWWFPASNSCLQCSFLEYWTLSRSELEFLAPLRTALLPAYWARSDLAASFRALSQESFRESSPAVLCPEYFSFAARPRSRRPPSGNRSRGTNRRRRRRGSARGAGVPLGGGAVGVDVWLVGGGGAAGLLCAMAQPAQLKKTNSVVIRANMMTSEAKYDHGQLLAVNSFLFAQSQTSREGPLSGGFCSLEDEK